jgi:hypothetical protein
MLARVILIVAVIVVIAWLVGGLLRIRPRAKRTRPDRSKAEGTRPKG